MNVLISRAKEGMFIFGNGQMLQEKAPNVWGPIIQLLSQKKLILNHIPIVCKNHPNTHYEIQNSNDFKTLSPEGGCELQCEYKLKCGHTCKLKCHPDDLIHSIGKSFFFFFLKFFRVFYYFYFLVECDEPCNTIHPCDHVCPKKCHEKCGNCMVPLKGPFTLPCGHVLQTIYCYQKPNIAQILCLEKVTKYFPECGHTLELECEKSKTVSKCLSVCNETLPCRHPCKNICCKTNK